MFVSAIKISSYGKSANKYCGKIFRLNAMAFMPDVLVYFVEAELF